MVHYGIQRDRRLKGDSGEVRAVKTELKRALSGKSFLLAAAGMALCVLAAAYPEVLGAYAAGGAMEGEHRVMLLHALKSDIIRLAVPCLAPIPFAASFAEDLRTGFHKPYLIRTKRRAYALGKALAASFSGGLAAALGIIAAGFALARAVSPIAHPGAEQTVLLLPKLFELAAAYFLSGCLWAAAAAAAVALGVFLLPERAGEDLLSQKQDMLVETVQEDVVPNPLEWNTPDPVLTEEPEATPIALVSRQTLLSEATSIKSMPVPEDLVPDAVHPVVPVDETSTAETEETLPETVDKVLESVETVIEGPKETEEIQTDRKPARKRFSISAYRYGGQASVEQMQGYGMNRTGAYLTRSTSDDGAMDVVGMMRMLSSNRSSTFEVRHGAPVRTGVTASWELTPYLNLVSGLCWTSLHSEFDESARSIHTVSGQNLGYLGIPLRLETGVRLWKGLWLHAGAGGMVEKGLLSSSWTNSWVDGQMAESVKNPSPDMGGLLWSLGASAGAEYRFGRTVGIYLTPGIEYHFDNGADVRSVYTEKPLHWSMELGIRFHFGES